MLEKASGNAPASRQRRRDGGMKHKHIRGLRGTAGEFNVSSEKGDVDEVIGFLALDRMGRDNRKSVRSRRVLPSSGFDHIFNILIAATRSAPRRFVNLTKASNPVNDTRGILSAQVMFGLRLRWGCAFPTL